VNSLAMASLFLSGGGHPSSSSSLPMFPSLFFHNHAHSGQEAGLPQSPPVLLGITQGWAVIWALGLGLVKHSLDYRSSPTTTRAQEQYGEDME
jgi:hypothetical protein